MNYKKITLIFIISVIVAIAIYDVWVIAAAGNNDASISAQLIEWSYNYPLFPFAIGIVCGHIFWGKKSLKNDDR